MTKLDNTRRHSTQSIADLTPPFSRLGSPANGANPAQGDNFVSGTGEREAALDTPAQTPVLVQPTPKRQRGCKMDPRVLAGTYTPPPDVADEHSGLW